MNSPKGNIVICFTLVEHARVDYCYVDKQQLKDASCYDVDDYYVKGDEAPYGNLE